MPASLAAARSATEASPRQSALSSSASAFASSRPSRWRDSASRLTGAAMRTRPTPLPAALALRVGGDSVAAPNWREIGRRLGRRSLLGLFEHDLGCAPVAVDDDVLA